MSITDQIKSILVYGYRPTPSHDYLGESDDGKCLIYRNQTNGENLSICVEKNTDENWKALYQLKIASKLVPARHYATAQDFLKNEKAYGSGPLGLTPDESNSRAYKLLANITKKSGINISDELPQKDKIQYDEAMAEIEYFSRYRGVSSMFVVADSQASSVSIYGPHEDVLNCGGNVYLCRDIAVIPALDSQIHIRCDNTDLICETIKINDEDDIEDL